MDLSDLLKTLTKDEKPSVPQVTPAVHAYRDSKGNTLGGSLHIVLDDGNVDDFSVKFCIAHARGRDDIEGVALGEVLLRMSRTQRKKIAEQFYQARS